MEWYIVMVNTTSKGKKYRKPSDLYKLPIDDENKDVVEAEPQSLKSNQETMDAWMKAQENMYNYNL